MIVLDTNVISEPLRAKPDASVLAWLDRQAPETLYLTSITLAELQAGIEVLPMGKRRRELQEATTEVVAEFEGRVLPFDRDSVPAFARVYASTHAAGNRIHFGDCAIAAIAMKRGFVLATRNTRDYRGADIELINPWHIP